MTVRAWQVGGHVRDRLMGVASKDLDYAVEAPDYETMLVWIKERGTVFLEAPQFWTVRAKLAGGQPADYVLCRKDGQYTDGRRPDSVSVGTLADDLARRDFTVNAIAFDESTGEFVDPFNGREDLKANLLRCVGNARDRFEEDALRLLRALRFHVTKGFHLHDDVVLALRSEGLLGKLASSVSTERKREELQRCFAHDTLATLRALNTFPGLSEACFAGGRLWLLPTMKET